MPKGYWIVRVDIADQEKYKAYIAANAAPLTQYAPASWSVAASTKPSKAAAAPATP